MHNKYEFFLYFPACRDSDFVATRIISSETLTFIKTQMSYLIIFLLYLILQRIVSYTMDIECKTCWDILSSVREDRIGYGD